MSAFEARTRFGELLGRVARGEEVVITRYDRAVARVIPVGGHDPQSVAAAVEGLLALQREIAAGGLGQTLSDEEVRQAIEAGRK